MVASTNFKLFYYYFRKFQYPKAIYVPLLQGFQLTGDCVQQLCNVFLAKAESSEDAGPRLTEEGLIQVDIR
jgi:hypothetical protein